MKAMQEENWNTEKIEREKRSSFREIGKNMIKKEWRLFSNFMSSAFKDPSTLMKWIFSPKTVDKGIRENAKYFELFPDNPNGIAILACHGFAATPEIYKDVGVKLQQLGYYFRAIRLSGHGTTPGHLATKSGEDWFASVVWHYKEVDKNYNRIFYLGHSLGGTLGLLLCTLFPIENIITLCTPVNLHIRSARFVRQTSAFIKYWPKSPKKRKLIKEEGILSYDKNPLYAIAGIFEVGKVLRERADKLKLPIFYVRAMKDHRNLRDQPDEFRKYFPNTPITFRDAENSGHSVLLGPERELIHTWIIEWFEEHR